MPAHHRHPTQSAANQPQKVSTTMTLRAVWERVNVDLVTGVDDEGRTIYESKTIKRNEEVPEQASDFTRSLLLSIGAVKDDGLARAVVENAARAETTPVPAPVLTPDQPPAPNAPSGGFGDFAGATEQIGVQNVTVPPPGQPASWPSREAAAQEAEASDQSDSLPQRPLDRDRKDVWEDYAVDLGIDRATAESYTKPDLIVVADEKRAELESDQA